jgi:chemotaxis protein methyltransferase CheR
MSPHADLSPRMTAEEFRLLRELIQDHCGLCFRDGSAYLLERRLWPRLQVHGLAEFLQYYRLLRFSAGRRAELETAVELLTTNETYFFREPDQLRAFSEEILPVLARENARERRLRIWSAGCSTGDEPYTLAHLVLESGLFQGWDIDVFGSDISRRVLAVARAGSYGPHAFRSLEGEALKSRFRHDGGRWTVAPEIRRLVSFGHLNLLDDGALALVGRVDAVFCRNVMIYFDLPTRKRVVRSFHQKLHDGRFLFLGHSESLLHVTADFELVHFRNDLVYRKPSAAPAR